jgi:spermidine synthase
VISVRILRVFALCFALLLCACAAGQKLIYEGKSPYGNIFVTEDADGLRTLLFDRGGARQSAGKADDPDWLELQYAKSSMVGVALAAQPRRMLVVGLGGGTLPRFLHRHYPEATIEAAEINPGVVEVAKKFFGFAEDERMRVHVGDGRAFIESVARPTYDVVLLDAFNGDTVPESLTTREFLQAVRRSLTPGGVVISNVWARSANPIHDDMVRTYLDVFDEVYVLDVPGVANTIVMALPRRQELDSAQLVVLARKAGAAARFPYDLGDRAKARLVSGRDYRAGRVLRDAPR